MSYIRSNPADREVDLRIRSVETGMREERWERMVRHGYFENVCGKTDCGDTHFRPPPSPQSYAFQAYPRGYWVSGKHHVWYSEDSIFSSLISANL